MLPSLSADEKHLRSLTEKLNRALRKDPSKASGRHWYIHTAVGLIRARAAHGGIPQSAFNGQAMKHLFANHAVLMARHNLAFQVGLNMAAARASVAKRAALEEDIEDLRTRKETLQ